MLSHHYPPPCANPQALVSNPTKKPSIVPTLILDQAVLRLTLSSASKLTSVHSTSPMNLPIHHLHLLLISS